MAAGFSLHLQKIINESAVVKEQPGQKDDSPDRPWVSLEVVPIGPLAYDDRGWDVGLRWHIPFKYRLKNTRTSPAVAVDVYGTVIPFIISHWPSDKWKDGVPQGAPLPGTDAAAELKKLCANAASMAVHMPAFQGRTLFRDQAIEGVFHLNGNPALFEVAKNSQGYSGNFLVIFCVTYRFASDDRPHQTADAFALFKPNSKINISGETIPLSELGFTSQPMGGAFAN